MPPVKNDNVLPADFDGVFRFTNASDREFSSMWNKISYTYPPMSTSPMIISGASPEDVQYIRRKFAREYAEREFYRSGRYQELNKQALPGSGNPGAIYTEEDLAPYIQQCLEPLPAARATASQQPRDKSENYHPTTEILDNNDLKNGKSLIAANGSGVLTE